ncbi:hypothetical protein TNCV_1776861 [Trichonephila clavipes]|nr:hypothetical protein TNCV_1776861 [Trichonephila clavipes]
MLPVRLINTTNERRLVQGHETTPLRVKEDIENVLVNWTMGVKGCPSLIKLTEFYFSRRRSTEKTLIVTEVTYTARSRKINDSKLGHSKSGTSNNDHQPTADTSTFTSDGDQFNSCQVIYSQFGLAIHQNDHPARRRFVEWAQNEMAFVPDFHKRILFSEEAHFWLNGYVNKQNCRIWSEANPQVYVETPLYPEKLTVWCALWAGGILLQKR